jgi:hypothetical protein
MFTVLTGWLDRQERDVLRYLLEENRVLRRQLPGRRQQLTDSDRRRLAVRAYRLGRKRLRELTTVVTVLRNKSTRRQNPATGLVQAAGRPSVRETKLVRPCFAYDRRTMTQCRSRAVVRTLMRIAGDVLSLGPGSRTIACPSRRREPVHGELQIRERFRDFPILRHWRRSSHIVTVDPPPGIQRFMGQ